MLGNQITIVAVAYQVYRLTGSTFQVGAISLVSLPFLVAGSLYGGTVGDVVDKRKLLAWSALGLQRPHRADRAQRGRSRTRRSSRSTC